MSVDETNEQRHTRYANYVRDQFVSRVSQLDGVIYDETEKMLVRTHEDMMYHVKDIHEIRYSLDSTKEEIYTNLEHVIIKFYKQIESIKRIFCPDKTLYIILVNAVPIVSPDEDFHQMRMLIIVTPFH